jgi:hypothetical protein
LFIERKLAMYLVNSFAALLQPLAVLMTQPSFASFVTLITGWVFANRRTVTRMIVAAGAVGRKHYSSYHRLFAAARWSRDRLGLVVFDLIQPLVEDTIFLAVDDTLARKRGLKMFGTAMHHDPLLSSRGKTVTNWGHSWVVVGVIVHFPFWPSRPFCLPILFRLYLGKKRASKERRVYRTRPELAVEMLRLVCQHRQTRHFHVVADSAYGGQSVLKELPDNCDLTSRLLLNARLYDAPAPRKPGQKGRSRKRGDRLPTPHEILDARARRLCLEIYGRREHARVRDVEARVYAVPERPLRVVAVEALKGGRGREAFYSTAYTATATEILTWYAWRWSVEVAFHDAKQHLGFEDPQGWSRKAVERTAPVAMLLYGLIVLWFVQQGHRHYRQFVLPWYPNKEHLSFRDMLITLRRTSIREQFLRLGLSGQGSKKALEALENAVAIAA